MRTEEKPDQTQSQNSLEGVGSLHESQATSHGSLDFQSSHPDIESHANPMKTKAKTFFNRHSFAVFPFSNHSPLITRHFPSSERKTKGEEKANRYRAQLRIP
jgi:hypothetical protein